MQLGVVLWDYKAKDTGGNDAMTGGRGNCAPIPDYSRFALDRSQQASIALALSGTNQGTVFYDFINASGLGSLQTIIAPGSRTTGAVFPKFEITAKNTTSVEVTVQMPQTLFVAAPSSKDMANEGTLAPAAAAQRGRLAAMQLLQPKLRTVSRRPVIAPAQDGRAAFETMQASTTALAKILPNIAEKLRPLNKDAQGPETKEVDIAGAAAIFSNLKNSHEALGKSFGEGYTDEEAKILGLQKHAKIIVSSANDLLKKKVLKDLPLEGSLLTETNRLDAAARKLKPPTANAREKRAVAGVGKEPLDLITAAEKTVLTSLTPDQELSKGCGGNGILQLDSNTQIDYLALKDMLFNVVQQQNEQVRSTGGPEVALDTLTLTVGFEIILDMSAGTYRIFRLFPMVLPPQMGLHPDHTHTLKIVLHGQKKKADPNNSKNLQLSCEQRLQGEDGGICNRPEGKLLESLIEAVGQGQSASGSASTGP